MLWAQTGLFDGMDADLDRVRSEACVRRFMTALVPALGMKAHGPLIVEHFGETEAVKGFSAVQLILTSCVVLHTVDATGELYLDVTSCREFEPAVVVNLIRAFFGEETSVRTRMHDRDPELNPEVPNFPGEPERVEGAS